MSRALAPDRHLPGRAQVYLRRPRAIYSARESPRISTPSAVEASGESRLLVRLAHARDVPAILAIYAPFVRDTAVSFEYEPPTLAEMERRLRAFQQEYPSLVCERAGQVAGYAYASRFRSRTAYQWTAEVTVYVHPDHQRRGVAGTLYRSLLDRLRVQGFRTAVAGITLPNAGSVALHESLGFQPVGVFQRVGFKHGQWHDTGWWQIDLYSDGLGGAAPGGHAAPAPPPSGPRTQWRSARR